MTKLKRYLSTSIARKKSVVRVKRLSLDEISMRKGQQDFVTVVSDVDRSVLLEVIDSHRQTDITASVMH